MPVQNMYRIRASLSGWPGGPGLLTYYYKTTDPTEPGNTTDAERCADRVHDALENLDVMWPAFMRITIDPTVDVIQDVTGALVASVAVTPPVLIAGTEGSLSLPAAAMLCINFLTTDIINSHRVRGRSFIGPLARNGDADGSPTPTQLVQMNELGDDLTGTVNPQVVWHRPVSGANGKACDVVGHITRDRFAMLRSRRG